MLAGKNIFGPALPSSPDPLIMVHRYAPIPSQHPQQNGRQELEDAFESDNEQDDRESTPLNPQQPPQHTNVSFLHNQASNYPAATSSAIAPFNLEASAVPGAYDFEREYEYDYPPPGSPPHPSERALPNDYGNSNGLLPTSPVETAPRASFFRRAVGAFGAILPTHYTRISAEAPPHRVIGGGSDNDGVFANVMAKPRVARTVQNDDGIVHVVPEDVQKESPPTYAEAQADAVPSYWETTVHAPSMVGEGGDMLIEGLPVGPWAVFFLNIFISWFFQFVGFLLTYLLHTTHAAKFGSRVGLGMTLIQFGFYSRFGEDDGGKETPDTAISIRVDNPGFAPDDPPPPLTIGTKDIFAFVFMTMGWFLVLSSMVGFVRVKRWQYYVNAPLSRPAEPPAPSREARERDDAVRRNLLTVFGIPMDELDPEQGEIGDGPLPDDSTVVHDEHGNPVLLPGPQYLAEVRLARNLRASGLV